MTKSFADMLYPCHVTPHFSLYNGDCLEVLEALEDSIADSLVSDPPAGISFMDKAWDGDKGGRDQWVNWLTTVMKEAYRVLKPGAHGLVWALPRTSHWTATALENAGFEVRDVVTHLFGTGFPKSLDVSKAIDKAAGVVRELGPTVGELNGRNTANHKKEHEVLAQVNGWDKPTSVPTSAAAKQWQGWGTALKPASEHWILVRKPCSEKTVVANVLKWGCGALNIDASRIEAADQAVLDAAVKRMTGNAVRGHSTDNFVSGSKSIQPKSAQGRFPANLILDEQAAEALDEQSGTLAGDSPNRKPRKNSAEAHNKTASMGKSTADWETTGHADKGGASRFFFVAKASKSDKHGKFNDHPTVKSQALMRYLITLVTPPGGTVLDPFAGSGTTGVAALKDDFKFIGVEQDAKHFTTAARRLRKTPHR